MVEVRNINIELLELNEGQLYGLPKNPRWIRDTRFDSLKKSIEDAPEMLALREILVYPLDDVEGKQGKYIVIGGNMRLRACREIGYQEVPCKILDLETPVKKLREYVIKDNEAFGQNDYETLSNEWDEVELQDWGMELDAFSPSTVDFDRVEDISEDNYETPQTKMLECPKCHHRDFAIHFKSIEVSEGLSAGDDDYENVDAEAVDIDDLPDDREE